MWKLLFLSDFKHNFTVSTNFSKIAHYHMLLKLVMRLSYTSVIGWKTDTVKPTDLWLLFCECAKNGRLSLDEAN